MIESPSRLEVVPIQLKDTITDGISWLILINSKSHDNHYSLPSREEAPVGIGLSLLFHETLSVISSCGWSDSCFDVFGEDILLQNCDCAAFELFPLPNIYESTLGIGEPCVTLQARVASSPDTTLTCGEARLMWIKMKIENTNHEIGTRKNRKWVIQEIRQKKQSLKRQGVLFYE